MGTINNFRRIKKLFENLPFFHQYLRLSLQNLQTNFKYYTQLKTISLQQMIPH